MDYERKNKPKTSSCMHRGPGPRYMLPTLIGFDDHDPSRYRNPAYSMKFRPKTKFSSTGPGPYPITQHLTHKGPFMPPAYTMAFKPHSKYSTISPGPGAYAPEKCPPANHERRAAAYSVVFRHDKFHCQPGPGPIYMLPTCIGPAIPDVRAEPGYSMAFRRKYRQQHIGPGPAAYTINLDTYKKTCPAYSMKFRHRALDNSRHVPGPQYSYETDVVKRRPPKYSFGVKYSECSTVGIAENDDD